jgi:hypothetical protein
MLDECNRGGCDRLGVALGREDEEDIRTQMENLINGSF